MRLAHPLVLLLGWLLLATVTHAVEPDYHFDQPEQAQRFHRLLDQFRCPKCQNTNLSGSDAPIAADLREHIYRQMNEGRSDSEIENSLVDRYGEFVLYKPRVQGSNWLLWLAPGILLLGGLGYVGWLIAKRAPRAAPTAALDSEERARLDRLLQQQEPPP